MKNIIEFLKKHKTKILIGLLLIFFFRSCGASRDVRVLEKNHKTEIEKIKQQNEIDKLNSYNEGQVNAYNIVIDDVSKVNRPAVLMELHNKWINDKDQINKKIK